MLTEFSQGTEQVEARLVITSEQVELLADTIGTGRPGFRELVLLLSYGGLRPNEAFAPRRRHIDDSGNVLVADGLVEVRGHLVETDGKTHRCRTVTLQPWCRRAGREPGPTRRRRTRGRLHHSSRAAGAGAKLPPIV